MRPQHGSVPTVQVPGADYCAAAGCLQWWRRRYGYIVGTDAHGFHNCAGTEDSHTQGVEMFPVVRSGRGGIKTRSVEFISAKEKRVNCVTH